MAAPLPNVPPVTPRPPSLLWAGIKSLVAQLHTPGNALGMPDNFVRATITFALVGVYLWMQWSSPDPKSFVVPGALVGAVGLVTGFYLTSDASVSMKALLSIVYSLVFAAFMAKWGWVPESVNTQVTTVLGIYFGKKILEAQQRVPAVTDLTAEQRAALVIELQKPVVPKVLTGATP